MTKFARAEILEVKGSRDAAENPTLEKLSSFEDYKTDDGYLYTRVRAISSRVNKNNDGWPSEELANSYLSFLHKPIFVDHHNADPKKARGVIVDSKLHVEEDLDKASSFDPYYSSAPENHKPPTWVELLLEVDARSFPHLAKAIISGDIDGVSMGANVDESICSICSNLATSPKDYCEHIQNKGASYPVDEDGHKTSRKAYEDCQKISFFEISYVFDPADETALVLDKKTAKFLVHAEAGDLNDDELEAYEQQQREMDKDRVPLDEHDKLLEQFRKQLDEGSTGILPNVQNEADAALSEENPARSMADRYQQYHEQKMREVPEYAEAYNRHEQNQAQDFANEAQQGIDSIPDLRDEFHRYLLNDPKRQITPDDFNYSKTAVLVPGIDSAPNSYTCAACGQHVDAIEAFTPGMHQQKTGHNFVPLISNQGQGAPTTTPSSGQVPTFAAVHCASCGSDIEDGSCPLGHKTAEHPDPQFMLPHAPHHVNTLRQEKPCPQCGSDMEDGHCPVCNYETPPEGFDNPDLNKARELQENQAEQEAQAPPMAGGADGGAAPPEGAAPGGAPAGGMSAASPVMGSFTPVFDFVTGVPGYLNTTTVSSSSPTITYVGSVKQPPKIQRPILPIKIKPSDAPISTKTVQDQSRPVESNANTKGENPMNYTKAQVERFAHTLVLNSKYPDYDTAFKAVTAALTKAAEGASPAAPEFNADQRVNVQDVGGFDNLTPESWADKTVDVEGVGAVEDNPEAGTEHVDVTKAEDTASSGPTKTWSGTDGQASPVTPEAGDFFTVSGEKKANLFPDDDDFGKQINVENPLTPEGIVGPPTETWSGMERQHDPVTNDVFPGIDVRKSSDLRKAVEASNKEAAGKARDHLLNAIKTAEAELELGMLEPDNKWPRVQELDQESPEQLQARLDGYDRMNVAKVARTTKRVAGLTAPKLGQSRVASSATLDKRDEDAAIFV
jgi:hypothetical protein